MSCSPHNCGEPCPRPVVLWGRRHTRASWLYGNLSHPRTPDPGSLTGTLARARRPVQLHSVPGLHVSFFSCPTQSSSGTTDAGGTHPQASTGFEEVAVLF